MCGSKGVWGVALCVAVAACLLTTTVASGITLTLASGAMLCQHHRARHSAMWQPTLRQAQHKSGTQEEGKYG